MLSLERLQARVGTKDSSVDIGNLRVRPSGGLGAHADGDRVIAQALNTKYSNTEIYSHQFNPLLKTLLKEKDEVSTSPTRNLALNLVYDIASDAGTYAVGVNNFPGNVVTDGFIPVRLPPIDSTILIEKGVVSSEEAKAQIKSREDQLTRRYKGKLDIGKDIVPPENWLILKILSRGEIGLFQNPSITAHRSDKAVIFIQEHFTRTLPQFPQYDIDVVGNYLLFETGEGIQLLFLGEEHGKPHYHYYNEGTDRWEQVDYDNLSPIRRTELEGTTMPQPNLPKDGDYKATNKQLAKLLVFFRFCAVIDNENS